VVPEKKNVMDRRGEEEREAQLNTVENKFYFFCHYYSTGKFLLKY
jgi:hypothetical protein